MDIKTIVQELIAAGMTQMEIERQSGVDQSTVSGILTGKRGKRPSWCTFDALQRLHSRICGKTSKRTRAVAANRKSNARA